MPKLQGKLNMQSLLTTGRCINNNYGFDKLQPLLEAKSFCNQLHFVSDASELRHADETNEA